MSDELMCKLVDIWNIAKDNENLRPVDRNTIFQSIKEITRIWHLRNG